MFNTSFRLMTFEKNRKYRSNVPYVRIYTVVRCGFNTNAFYISKQLWQDVTKCFSAGPIRVTSHNIKAENHFLTNDGKHCDRRLENNVIRMSNADECVCEHTTQLFSIIRRRLVLIRYLRAKFAVKNYSLSITKTIGLWMTPRRQSNMVSNCNMVICNMVSIGM